MNYFALGQFLTVLNGQFVRQQQQMHLKPIKRIDYTTYNYNNDHKLVVLGCLVEEYSTTKQKT